MSLNAKDLVVYSTFFILMVSACSINEQGTPKELEEQLAKHIRTTEALTPDKEKAAFTLPPGFEIQLFASEPDIGKPMNMAFDAQGRMWVTQSNEYPFPDTTGNTKDKISILEDTDGDGRADKFTVFADSLNIPIGITTVADGAIAYSIPSIYHFIDHDGDDKVDERKVLYTGFQYKDTHGMINNLVRSWDGWIHADHGFANTSTVAGSDGDTIVLQSGNTFRFRMDGSRIEFTTTGRVNPFGYAYDELGYTYSVDCHSSPIYQLVRGADYPHFGKKPTGIGFGPALMSHNYGSTALAGLDYYIDDQYPTAFQHSFYLGDVVKSKVYRSTMQMKGTTPEVKWEEDFIVSNDPWFRPVDVKLGPDGAIYIADFYNRIIGHYEVPLDHPGRDRQRGRIWRIIYTGNDVEKEDRKINWSTAGLDELIEGLDHPNLPLRMRLADQIVDHFGQQAVEPVTKMIQASETTAKQYVQGMWILYRLNASMQTLLAEAIQHENQTIQVHALRILFEMDAPAAELLQLNRAAMKSGNPHLQRQAVMVAAKNPVIEQVSLLLEMGKNIPEEDSHFAYSVKQSLRDHFRDPDILRWGLAQEWQEEEAKKLAAVMVGVDLEDAARFLLAHLQQYAEPQAKVLQYAKHAAIFLQNNNDLDQLLTATRQTAGDDLALEYPLYRSIQAGTAQAGREMTAKGKAWGVTLARNFLQPKDIQANEWRVKPNDKNPYAGNPWHTAGRKLKSSDEEVLFLASGPIFNGGGAMSTMYSPSFTLEGSLSFYLLGQKNEIRENQTPLPPANKVELRLAENDEVIHEQWVSLPEHEKQINWNTNSHKGEKAYLAIIDGSSAWGEFIAVGGIQPSVLTLPEESPKTTAEKQIFACQVAQQFKTGNLSEGLDVLLNSPTADIYARAAAGEALYSLNSKKAVTTIQPLIKNDNEALLLKEQLATVLSNPSYPDGVILLMEFIGDLSYRKQKALLQNISQSPTGIKEILNAAENAQINPRLLLEPQLRTQLAANLSPQQEETLAQLTAGIPPLEEERQAMINTRLRIYGQARHSIEQGSQIFTQHCAACHEMNGQGGNIGPQLDGIGNWGSRALTEKILDPNRNISKAFKNYTITLKNGESKSGLFRREEGELLVFADLTGKEFTVDKSEVAEQELSPYTLMPDYFGEVIAEEDYYDLLAFLLNER